MKKIHIAAIAAISLALSACNGFTVQKDYKYKSQPLDPHVGVNAWEFMQTRSDLSEMVKAVEYTGLQDLYTQEDRTLTYLFLNNTAFANFKNVHAQVENITAIDVEQVKRLLQYHIVIGEYHSLNQKLPVQPIYVKTLLDGEWGLMTLKVNKSSSNSIGYPISNGNIVANEKGSIFNSRQASSIASNIMPTNGFIHIMNDYAMFRKTATDESPF